MEPLLIRYPLMQTQGHLKKDIGYASGAIILGVAGLSLYQGLKD
jgi:hypothetical protein